MKKFNFTGITLHSLLLLSFVSFFSLSFKSTLAQQFCANETILYAEDFGSGVVPTSHPDVIPTALTYQPTGDLVGNGVYRVINNTFQNPDWHTSNDRTGTDDGKMLVVNGIGNTFYSHVINRPMGFTAGYYSASLYLMNVTKIIRCTSDILEPVITFTLDYQAEDGSWVPLIGSPYKSSRVRVAATPTWKLLGNVFALPTTGNFIVQNFRLTLNDGTRSGCGIDYALDDIKIATCPSGGPLPVEFLSVSAKQRGTGVAINWSTASETNLKYYDVEKSIDGVSNWDVVATNKASGNSSIVKRYNAFDAKPVAGMNYYRIKQVDFDGRFEHSIIVHVKMTIDKTYASVLTNPFISDVAIDFLSKNSQPVSISLFDLSGKRIATDRWVIPGGSSRKSFDKVKSLQKGIYILNIVDARGTSIYKGKLEKQ